MLSSGMIVVPVWMLIACDSKTRRWLVRWTRPPTVSMPCCKLAAPSLITVSPGRSWVFMISSAQRSCRSAAGARGSAATDAPVACNGQLGSRTPDGVRQEIWGIALAYNLVRLEMERAADEAKVEPNRISFVNAVALIRNAWFRWSMVPLAPGRIPEGLLDLRRCLKLLILPPRRPERAYPRAVKIKMSPYARKRPTGKGRK